MKTSNDLISRSADIVIIENKRLQTGKHNLSVEYALADLQEKIERLNTAYNMNKLLKDIELVVILGIVNIVIPLLMLVFYIAQAGPI